MQVKRIEEIARHRNGICGEPFYAVRFVAANDMAETPVDANFLAILFDGPGQCAVICLDLIESCGVKFARNSWRGDHFETELRQAIDEARNRGPLSGGIPFGPFVIPTE